jgi:gentisate 1,2-dioxygenase
MAHSNSLDLQQRMQALNAGVEKASLRGAWEKNRAPRRQEEIPPRVWHWQEMLPHVLESGELVPIDEFVKMRTLHMVNPSEVFPLGTTSTFAAMLQHLNPGEATESHRHTATSVYFMIQGSRVYTTAQGEQQFMQPGDLLTQPNWTWHGTTNPGTEPAIWFTAMDTSLTQYLNAWFNEKYPAGFSEPVTKPDGYYMRRSGALRSSAGPGGKEPVPIRYCWRDALETLEDLARMEEADPHDGVVLDYTDPRTGGPTTATLGCRLQMLRPGEETRSHRHTCSTIYHVVRGAGITRIGKNKTDERSLNWLEHDCFSIPPWHWHRFRNESSRECAILFSVSDRPLLDAVRLYREES